MDCHKATAADARFLFELRNLDSNRIQFRNPDKVEWESHEPWVARFLKNERNRMYVFSVNNEKIGMFRVDESGDVSVSLLDEFKGKGYGSEMIKIGSSFYLKDFPEAKLFAEIKKENAASSKAFMKAGYKLTESLNSDYILLDYAGEK
ncbi:RimJ/RimL family protein N-acetyltransferase [Bacteriovorax stolpii]|nr:GNAT family N-acetyltransferase [Bacteriovorax stolpii]TDP53101.1 RimJ/RimL family protein N-acetyltransferase [Bacteriovorax stolpii]